MKHDQVLRIGSLVGKNKVRDAARHNLRELPPEPHIDPSRSDQNCVLHGAATADGVAQQGKAMLDAVDRIRTNAILGVELLVCLPFSFNGDAMAFFTDALAWVDEFYQVPVLSAVAHFDESAPHMHVLLLPIIDGRLQGSVVMGDRKRIQAMQGDFYANVGRKYGLRRKAAQRLASADRRNAAMQILNAITANPALLNGGMVKRLVLDLIAQNLEPFSASVGVALPEAKAKASKETFVSIMTKPQRPERRQSSIGVHQKPIGVFGPAVVPNISGETANSYALLGDLDLQRVEAPVVSDVQRVPDADLVPVDDGDFERIRDGEIGADCWDADRGEMIRQPAKASRKAQADHAIRAALSAVGRYH